MNKFSFGKGLLVIGAVSAFLITAGCDEVYRSTRAAAEEYAKENPNKSTDQIFIEDENGKTTRLSDLQYEESQKKAEVTTGEVLKYEEPASTTDKASVELFNIGSIMAVFNGGTSAIFTLEKKAQLKTLTTYHWNDAKGSPGGTLGLKDSNGKIFGPWAVTTSDGQGGAPSVYWAASPDVTLEPGTYTVVDSDPATWSQNEETGGVGMTWGTGYYIE